MEVRIIKDNQEYNMDETKLPEFFKEWHDELFSEFPGYFSFTLFSDRAIVCWNFWHYDKTFIKENVGTITAVYGSIENYERITMLLS